MAEWSSADLVAQLHALTDREKSPERPLVVGVTGVDAAGKSQLAASLAERLRAAGSAVQLIHVDDFHRPHAQRCPPEVPEPQQFREHSIDFPRLRRELLEPIRRGGVDARLRLLDHLCDTWSVCRDYRVNASTVVLLEGIFLLRPELRPFLDVTVFLHVDDATVLARAAVRDVPSRGVDVLDRYRRKYLPGQREHLAANPPHDHADIIVDNRDYTTPKVLKWPGLSPVVARDADT